MAIGYSPDAYVWVIDRTAGMAYPTPKDNPELADTARYEVDAKHDVVDSRGVLLDAKPVEPTIKPAKPAAAGKES